MTATQTRPGHARDQAIAGEVDRIADALSEHVSEDHVWPWLLSPSALLHGHRPIDVIRAGQAWRIWRMIEALEEPPARPQPSRRYVRS